MMDASTGKPVTATDFRGKVVLLYFGYTLCPDFCPTTLTNLADVLDKLGALANQVRILFVTVDPNRDSLDTLKGYVKLFAPQIVGLRGTPDQLAELARRYRVAYSVTPASNGHPYQVTHSSIVFVFDAAGQARLILTVHGVGETRYRRRGSGPTAARSAGATQPVAAAAEHGVTPRHLPFAVNTRKSALTEAPSWKRSDTGTV